jgi:hypothetical protein
MGVTLKVGSKLAIPVLPGWTCRSTDAAILICNVVGTTLTIEAKKVGKATLTLAPANDLFTALTVSVVA